MHAPRFQNQSVLVTGATSGIGREIALAFGREGAHVGVIGRRAKEASEAAEEITASGGRGVAIPADVGDKEALSAAVAPFLDSVGVLAALVNAAGIDRGGLVADAKAADLESMFRTNTYGVLFMMQLVIPIMRKQGHGSIVNITSISASKIIFGNSLYGASKAATSLLTRTAAAEEGPNGIRINELQPGPVDTEMLRGFFKESATQGTGWDADRLRQSLPLRSLGTTGDIAAGVLWLCSEEARYVTGACLAMDGGFLVT